MFSIIQPKSIQSFKPITSLQHISLYAVTIFRYIDTILHKENNSQIKVSHFLQILSYIGIVSSPLCVHAYSKILSSPKTI